MFDKVLIANRGEIACRIIETARGMGIATVAVYSFADAAARHVHMADEAIAIGGAAPKDSYLRIEAIIEAAQATGAQAIHPGYGFLSENPDFVEAVEAAGLTFVGPSAKAIRAMGLKDAAKALMEKAGVPVVPGYHGVDKSDQRLSAAAEEIGYPVLIKAVAGGGGKGMRLVEDPAHFAQALASARAEAATAFGNCDVLVEKFVSRPRHIEFQIFGDGTRALHLFERDCSLQRRHQKVIEEAPAPGMSDAMRASMGAAAVRAAEAIGYSGAGTVEFIVDGEGGISEDGFYFMEMNTRLQVEHPVTEAITGIDLVAWQFQVAAGGGLPMAQEDLVISGHAFEARLYAEDVPAGFLPATGRLTHLQFPEGVRADSGVRAGDEITPWYDPMIAKLILHGPTRAVALSRLRQALRNTEVAGSVTNLGFLGALASHDGFGRAEIDTGLIGRDIDTLTQAPITEDRHIVAAGMAALGLFETADLAGFTLWAPLRQSLTLRQGEATRELAVEVLGPDRQLWLLEDRTVMAERRDTIWWIGNAPAAKVVRSAGILTVLDAYGLVFEVIDPLDRSSGATSDGALIEAPMPGVVTQLRAKAGQIVRKGDRLATLEAMKMEHPLIATRDGEVSEVLVAEGAQVTAGAPLIKLKEEEPA